MADTDRQVFAICVTAAFVFWLILNLSQDYTVDREVKLDYLVDPERVLVGSMPENIETDVTGTGWALIWEGIRPGPLPVEIDVRQQTDNRLTRAELEQQIQRRLSSGALSVSYMEFESVPLLTTPLEGKRVPIIPNIDVTVAPGYILTDSLQLSPDSVTINAGQDDLEEINSWPTEPLTIENLTSDAGGDIALQPSGATTIKLSRNEVRYSLRAEPFIQTNLLVPVEVINSPLGASYEITPRAVNITVNVPQSVYGRLRPSDFRIVADVGNQRDGSFSPNVALQIVDQPASVISAYLDRQVVTYYAIR
ncbi:hypothetical protein A3850_009695 [Lewinella sp. 4G2]|nr:hypothetical protein A3850_009695 [Lewinella sp. 4G2]